MISIKTTIKKFGQQGEKTGWTYIEIPLTVTEKLHPGNKRSFRVKGKIDEHPVKQVSLLPMGEGYFIMPLNAAIRKAIRKTTGAMVEVQLQKDNSPLPFSQALLDCLEDEPEARVYFMGLPASHRQYYSNWIESAKTDATKAKRIALSINAFLMKLSYGEMIRLQKQGK